MVDNEYPCLCGCGKMYPSEEERDNPNLDNFFPNDECCFPGCGWSRIDQTREQIDTHMDSHCGDAALLFQILINQESQ